MGIQVNQSSRLIGRPLLERVAHDEDSETFLIVIKTTPDSLVMIDLCSDKLEETDSETLVPAERAMLAKARLDETRKKVEDLKVNQAAGVLVSVEDCLEQMAVIKNAFVQMIDTLPDILERDCGLSFEVVNKVEQTCDKLRTKLAENLIQ